MLPGLEAARFQKVDGSWMGDVTDHIAATPVDRAVERLRSIYRNWTRDTSVEQMRSDWDAAFAGSMQRAMILALAKNYLGADGDPRDPLASPLYADLAGLPPLLAQVGDRETVRDDATALATRAEAAGVTVELQIWAGMIHVFQMFPEIPQAGEAIASLAGFLRRHLHIVDERAPR